MTFLNIWLAATAILVAVFFLYHFAPIVLFLLALTAALGGVTAAIVRLARAVERRR